MEYKDPLQKLYKPGKEKEYFDEGFLFKGEYYPHVDEVLIADVGGDGEDCPRIQVFISACPAQFFHFRIPAQNVSVKTGSGDWSRFKDVFEMLRDGMLVISS